MDYFWTIYFLRFGDSIYVEMKFLDDARLNSVTMLLDNCMVGDRRLRGRVEAYSCKAAGEDKKLAKTLEQHYVEELISGGEVEDGSYHSSPLGKLSDPNTRKLLINLICTLNATFLDYDFSDLKPDQFVQENTGMVINSVNRTLNEIVTPYQQNFLEELWSAIDSVVSIRNSLVFSYVPDMEDDPFSIPGAVWSFNHFFFNKNEKKIVFFTCTCLATRIDEFYGEETNHDEDRYMDSDSEQNDMYEIEMDEDEDM